MAEAQEGAEPTLEHPRWDGAYRGLVRVLGSKMLYPVEVAGEMPSGEPEIIIPNHIKYSEVVVQGIATYEFTGLPPAFMAKKELNQPLIGRALGRLGAFFVDRSEALMDRLEEEAAIAQAEGRSTIVYGEASRHKGKRVEGEVYRPGLKGGGLALAIRRGMNARAAGTVMRGHHQNLVFYGEAFDPHDVSLDELGDRMQEALDGANAAADEKWGSVRGQLVDPT